MVIFVLIKVLEGDPSVLFATGC